MLLAVTSVLMNQQCILSRVSLNRDTHKNKFVYQSIEENVSRGTQNPNPAFLLEILVQYSLIHCL